MSHHYSGPDFGFPHGDARLDFTDLYAFPKPGDAGKSILIMNVHPSASVNPPGPTTFLKYLTLPSGQTRFACGRARWTAWAGNGFRRTGARDRSSCLPYRS